MMTQIKQVLQDKRQLMTLSKYLFSLCLMMAAMPGAEIFFVSFMELVIIAVISNLLVQRKKLLGYLFNLLFLLLLNIQQLVMLFGRSFTTLVMLTNLDSLESLNGKLPLMVSGVAVLLLFTAFPIVPFAIGKGNNARILSLFLLMELIFTSLFGSSYSPIFAVYGLAVDAKLYQEQMEEIKNQPNVTASFYSPDIISVRERPSNLPENPNIVLIFVEGLSQHIIEDDREGGVMPHTAALREESVNFTNYYNHTFATYRGLIGQLFSGHQLSNYDNSTLVSIQDILVTYGYQTTFINSEPSNTQFTSYLENLEFQHLITDPTKGTGINKSLTDQTSLELLYETIEEQHQSDQPFFTTIYTYGTHTTFDSPDKKFGQGDQPLLNRFYNFDYYFGEFIEKFKKSGMAKDTILVFTSDHATYADKDFQSAYPDYNRTNAHVDSIPFFIYYDGVAAETVDVQGRNSLSLAPTILDYIDISSPNYFLGMSLYYMKENNNSYDTVFFDTMHLLSTDYGAIAPLSPNNEEIMRVLLKDYFAAKTQMPQIPE